jgi:ParB-like chromosome segregation protein Spo0J
VHDAAHAGGAQPVAERRRLGAAQRAQVKAVEVSVEDAMRIFDIRMSDQEEPAQRR